LAVRARILLAEDGTVTLFEVVAATLLLLGSVAILRAVMAADAAHPALPLSGEARPATSEDLPRAA
jgi:hypothetical protein